MLYYAILCCTMPHHTMPHHTILYYTILYYTILYYTIPYHTIPYHTILLLLLLLRLRLCTEKEGDGRDLTIPKCLMISPTATPLSTHPSPGLAPGPRVWRGWPDRVRRGGPRAAASVLAAGVGCRGRFRRRFCSSCSCSCSHFYRCHCHRHRHRHCHSPVRRGPCGIHIAFTRGLLS